MALKTSNKSRSAYRQKVKRVESQTLSVDDLERILLVIGMILISISVIAL